MAKSTNKNISANAALHCIILFGIVSLFGDITYEGARGITGPYLALLGASAAVVGAVSGIGEFLGYALRFITGYFADRTRGYWPMTIAGYALMFGVPLLVFANHWQIAAFLIIMERVGKAVRSPARDTILSHATKQVGRGWGFGIHEALDQIGAVLGALIFSFALLFKDNYRTGFAVLWIPAVLTMVFLAAARIKYPSVEEFEAPAHAKTDTEAGRKLSAKFWFYTLFIFLSVAGFANFQLVSYHFKVQSLIKDYQIPLFYAGAMLVDAVVALIIGKTYDKIGLKSLLAIPLLTAPVAFFGFSHSYGFALTGVLLWGAVMGVHETIMRAAIADLVGTANRGFAYGVFNTAYGASWFFGGAAMGLLYGVSIKFVIAFAVLMQILALILFFSKIGRQNTQ